MGLLTARTLRELKLAIAKCYETTPDKVNFHSGGAITINGTALQFVGVRRCLDGYGFYIKNF